MNRELEPLGSPKEILQTCIMLMEKTEENKRELTIILSRCRQELGYVELDEIIKIIKEAFDDEELFIIKGAL